MSISRGFGKLAKKCCLSMNHDCVASHVEKTLATFGHGCEFVLMLSFLYLLDVLISLTVCSFSSLLMF